MVADHGRAITNSQNVAACFEKRHGNVVRSIRSLLGAVPPGSQLNFELAEYVDDQGKNRPSYNMDRDAFTLIAMSFTGPKALRFKLAYIYRELVGFINGLDIEEQLNLVALAWLGRGTYDKSEWKDALSTARREHNKRTAQYLLGLPLLGDYLEEGLSQFGRSCSDETDTR